MSGQIEEDLVFEDDPPLQISLRSQTASPVDSSAESNDETRRYSVADVLLHPISTSYGVLK